jgi:hypothetical protein
MLWKAAKMVKKQNVSVYQASKQMGVPWSSLRDFLSQNPQQNRKKQTCLNWEGRSHSQLISK